MSRESLARPKNGPEAIRAAVQRVGGELARLGAVEPLALRRALEYVESAARLSVVLCRLDGHAVAPPAVPGNVARSVRAEGAVVIDLRSRMVTR